MSFNCETLVLHGSLVIKLFAVIAAVLSLLCAALQWCNIAKKKCITAT